MIQEKRGQAWPIDWGSHKIHRIIRSTLASEASSASNTFDRLSYIRTIVAEMIYGWKSDWNSLSRKVAATMVTDCKSLKDLTDKIGSLPAEIALL